MKCIPWNRLCGVAAAVIAICAARYASAVEPDIPRIQAGAERGSIEQEVQLAAAYFAGRGVTRDEKQAAYWYEKAANSGDPGAQVQIGFFYEAGIGVERNSARAAAWFERAMAGGSIAAKVNLGVAYIWGSGVRKDPELGTQLFREAADKGSGSGAFYLGDAYYFGIGVERDLSKARHWLEVAAKRHDPQGELALALMLLKTPDQASEERAFKLLREAAKNGYVPAGHELALRLVRKPEFTSAPREALQHLEKASSQGFWKSSVVLAALYRDGIGVPKNPELAYLDFRIAELQGGDPATKMVRYDLQALELSLEPSRIESLNTQAADWVAHHPRGLEFAPFPGSESLNNFALAFPEQGSHAGRIIPAGEVTSAAGETFRP